MTKIGFIGVGHMGAPMAVNLLKAGHDLVVFDLNTQAVAQTVEHGAIAAHSLAELAAQCDVIITMLQTGEQVKEVCLSSNGLFSHANSGTLFIDCSSIDVSSCREIQKHAQEASHIIVDAPVSGGVAGATAAALTIMVGGDQRAFEKALPILQCMGQKIIHTGDGGTGQAAKICNNMILGISMIAISESYVLAKRLGLSQQKLFEVASNASGQCWAMTKYSPVPDLVENVPSNNDYQPGFTSQMMLKDLKLSQDAAHDVGLETNLGHKATELYQQFSDSGFGEKDFSAIIKMISEE
jgi:3-hydroxyisobutyrate dehydrogenase